MHSTAALRRWVSPIRHLGTRSIAAAPKKYPRIQVLISLSKNAESYLLDCIPVNSRLCAVHLNGSVRIQKQRKTRLCLFVALAYALTNCRSDITKHNFYCELSSLPQQVKSLDVLILAGTLNAQVNRPVQSENMF